MEFIELTLVEDNSPIFINPQMIMTIAPGSNKDFNSTFIVVSSGFGKIPVKENATEVFKKLA